jgi:hypothetical protein
MKRTKGAPHKVVVCGSRFFENYERFENVLDVLLENMEIGCLISGGCKGTDTMVKKYCIEKKIIFVEVKPQWQIFGRYAGPKRNAQMVKLGTSTFGFWDGRSRGTYDMLKKARDAKHEYVKYYHIEKNKIEEI